MWILKVSDGKRSVKSKIQQYFFASQKQITSTFCNKKHFLQPHDVISLYHNLKQQTLFLSSIPFFHFYLWPKLSEVIFLTCICNTSCKTCDNTEAEKNQVLDWDGRTDGRVSEKPTLVSRSVCNPAPIPSEPLSPAVIQGQLQHGGEGKTLYQRVRLMTIMRVCSAIQA